jgi:hypothetical protein
MPDLIDPTAQRIETLAEVLHASLYAGAEHAEPWGALAEDERDEFRAMAVAGLDAVGTLAGPAVAAGRSLIERKVWAATLAGFAMAVLPIAYDAAATYVAGWHEAPPWITPLLVVAGTFVAGYRARHTERPDLGRVAPVQVGQL